MVGRVQGVSFRYSAQEEALRLRVHGWIRNRSAGDVEGAAEGDAAAVGAFLEWCREGPPGARVDSCHVDEEEYRGDLGRFEIRR